MVMLIAPLSSRLGVSVMLSVAMIFEGSVTFSIWTPSSAYAVTAAYVWPPDLNVVMPQCTVKLQTAAVCDAVRGDDI